MSRRIVSVMAILLLALAACVPAGKAPTGLGASNPTTSQTPSIQPSARPSGLPTAAVLAPTFPGAAAFASPSVTNPWYPLKPGTKWTYRGVKDGKASVDTFAVTTRTKTILGVRTTEVHDTLTQGGKPVEGTQDWYAQDAEGNVWYFGEATRKADTSGKLTNTEGSWQAGVAGATPGIIMPARPQVGQTFKQENFRGHAEDNFKIVSLDVTVSVPYGSFAGAMHTEEWTPIEPGVIDGKFYVRGIGQVSEASIQGPKEAFDLVSLSK